MPHRDIELEKKKDGKHNHVSTADKEKKILQALFDNGELMRSQLAKLLDLNKSSGDYDPLTLPMKKLNDIGLISSRTSPVKQRGRRPKLWKISRNVSALNKIYNDYPDLHDTIRQTDWVYATLINKKLKIKGEADAKEIQEMMRHSSTFFTTCMTRETIIEFVRRWLDHNEHFGGVQSQWASIIEDFDKTSEITLGSYKSFYMFCYFVDKLNHNITRDSTQLMLKYGNELRHLKNDF
jgi:predicted transcriptional regulator